MSCMDCRWFTGTQEPTQREKDCLEKNPPGCECIVGIVCPDIAEDDDRGEMRATSVEWANEVRGFNDAPDW